MTCWSCYPCPVRQVNEKCGSRSLSSPTEVDLIIIMIIIMMVFIITIMIFEIFGMFTNHWSLLTRPQSSPWRNPVQGVGSFFFTLKRIFSLLWKDILAKNILKEYLNRDIPEWEVSCIFAATFDSHLLSTARKMLKICYKIHCRKVTTFSFQNFPQETFNQKLSRTKKFCHINNFAPQI